MRVRLVMKIRSGVKLPCDARQQDERLHSRQHRFTFKMMVTQTGGNGDDDRQPFFHIVLGKFCHNRTVFGSTATGRPAALAAQCLVNPLHTS